MAKVIKGERRGRPGKWLLDFYDAAGVRHLLTFKSKAEAEVARARVVTEATQPRHPACDVNLTVAEYAARWLAQVEATGAKPRTLESYRSNLRLHILPRFGTAKVRMLHRTQVKAWAVERLQAGASRGTVRLLLGIVRALLGAAVLDDIIQANPAASVGRQLKTTATTEPNEKLKAFDRDQLRAFLAPAEAAAPRQHVFFLTLARTGIRLGEGIGLQWDDVDIPGRRITVARTLSRGREGTPKSGHARTVDMSRELAAALQRHLTEQKRAALANGWGKVPEWVFTSGAGSPLDASRVLRVMWRVLKAAGLPGHHSPHSFRHTFASILLQRGEPPQWVQEQLGHASLEMTTKVYGRWLRKAPLVGGVDGLDDGHGDKTVTAALSGWGGAAEVREVVDALQAVATTPC